MAIGNSKKQLLMVDSELDVGIIAIPMTNVVDVELTTNGEDINVVSPSMGAKRNYMDEYHSTASFNIETLLTGTTDTDTTALPAINYSNLDSLFLLCNMKRENIGTNIKYTLDSNADNVLDISFFKENVLRNITGAKGSFTISGTVGQPIKAVFNMSAYSDLVPTVVPDGSMPVATEASKMENIAVLKKISGVTIGGNIVNMTSFTLNENCEIQDTYATDEAGFSITDFDPQIEIIAYRVKNSIEHWVAYRNEDLKEIIISAEASNGKTIEIKVPFAKMLTVTDGDDNGRQIITRNYRCQNNLGDDNISITIK